MPRRRLRRLLDGPLTTRTSPVELCAELRDAAEEVPALTDGCDGCRALGTPWTHLRLCLTCGHVGCCDSSPGRHARRHHEATGHHIIRSAEPGDDWSYCLEDERELPPAPARTR